MSRLLFVVAVLFAWTAFAETGEECSEQTNGVTPYWDPDNGLHGKCVEQCPEDEEPNEKGVCVDKQPTPPDPQPTDPTPDPRDDVEGDDEDVYAEPMLTGTIRATLELTKNDHCFLLRARPNEGFQVEIQLTHPADYDYDLCLWKWNPNSDNQRKYDECASTDTRDEDLVDRAIQIGRKTTIQDSLQKIDKGDYLVCVDRFSARSARWWKVDFIETPKLPQ